MSATTHISRALSPKPTCLWRCVCGLTLIARRIDGRAELHYRGRRRTKCPHCAANLAEQRGA